MMEIIVKISAIQQLTFSRFRDLLTVPTACVLIFLLYEWRENFAG